MYERLLGELNPLYTQLHCYTRTKLNQKYGDAIQPATGPIRADLLGNMWAQEWGNIYDVVAPKGAGDIGYNIERPAQGQGLHAGEDGPDRRGLLHARSASRLARDASGSAR